MRHPRVDTTQGGATGYSFINKLLQIFYECVAYIRFQTRLIMASGNFCLSEGQNRLREDSIPFVKSFIVYVSYKLCVQMCNEMSVFPFVCFISSRK